MNDMYADDRLKSQTERIFIKNGASTQEAGALASMITAAAGMSRVYDNGIEEQVVIDQLLNLYDKNDDPEVTDYIGVGPQLVKNVIGYDVNFNDFNSAINNYNINKEKYDSLYKTIAKRAEMNNFKNSK